MKLHRRSTEERHTNKNTVRESMSLSVCSRCSGSGARCSEPCSWWTGPLQRWSPGLPGQQCAAGGQREVTHGEKHVIITDWHQNYALFLKKKKKIRNTFFCSLLLSVIAARNKQQWRGAPGSRWQWRGWLCGSCWRRRGASGDPAAGRRPAAWPWGLLCCG